MLILLFLYFGVIALGNAIGDRDSAAKACAVLAIVGVVNIPIISTGGMVELAAPDRQLQDHRKTGHAGGDVAAAAAGRAGFLLFLRCRAALYRMRLEVLKREARSSFRVKAEVQDTGGGQGMSFASFSEFLAMGTHGLYVWSAYGISLAILALNVVLPILARPPLPARRGASFAPGEVEVNPVRKKRLYIVLTILLWCEASPSPWR